MPTTDDAGDGDNPPEDEIQIPEEDITTPEEDTTIPENTGGTNEDNNNNNNNTNDTPVDNITPEPSDENLE